MIKTKRISLAIVMLIISALLLATASYAWFAMNTQTKADGLEVEAYTDSLFLQISTTDSDADYKTEVTFTTENTADLRLITASLFKSGLEFVKLPTYDTVADGTHYEGESTAYYEKVESDYGTGKYNFIKVEGLDPTSSVAGLYKNPTFTLVATNAAKTGTFYEYNTTTHVYTQKEITGASAYGLYEMNGTAEAADALYDGSSRYYKLDASTKQLVAVTNLSLGTDLSGLVTLDDARIEDATVAAAATDYYVVNGDDYSYIGAVDAETVLAEHLFWGRAYSSVTNDAQIGNTLNIIDSDDADDYYLTKTLYLRCAEGTNNASNLVIDEINIGGAANALSPTLRILFVATTSADASTPKRISAALYDHGATGTKITYSDGTNLFDTVLGNKAETVKVDVYVYFDGADEVANNHTVAGEQLNGQTIEIKFGIDELAYN